MLAARRLDRLEALATELGNARAVEIDLGREGSAAQLIANVEASGETIDLLVNNAGFGLHGRFPKADPARLRQMIDLNCGALTELARGALPGMIAQSGSQLFLVAGAVIASVPSALSTLMIPVPPVTVGPP